MARNLAKKRRGIYRGKRVGVLMGGESSERAISLKTGRAVLAALKDKGYDALKIEGSGDFSAALKRKRVKVVFVALHGRFGEDGCVQGLLELMAIPYTGSGVLSSALCMDKAASKTLLRASGIATPDFRVVRGAGEKVKGLRLPVVVKPAREGSTIGISIVRKATELKRAIREAAKFKGPVLVERFVKGREVTVPVLEGRSFPAIEIKPHDGFYDYDTKYTKGGVDFIVPAELGRALASRVERTALASYAVLGCRGGARVDMIVDKSSAPQVLEVNTVPGLTDKSLFPMSAEAAGVGYADLVEEMLDGARLG